MRLVLLRHGQTDWNFEDRYQGRSDIPLNDTGRGQAQEAARRWKVSQFDYALVSPLSRAYDTGMILTEDRTLERTTLDDLMETAGGDWEGLTFTQIREQWPQTFIDWRSSNLDVGPINGETPRQAGERVSVALVDWVKANPADTVLVVGHGNALRAATALLSGTTEDDYPTLSRLENCRAHVLTSEQGTIGTWNLASENV